MVLFLIKRILAFSFAHLKTHYATLYALRWSLNEACTVQRGQPSRRLDLKVTFRKFAFFGQTINGIRYWLTGGTLWPDFWLLTTKYYFFNWKEPSWKDNDLKKVPIRCFFSTIMREFLRWSHFREIWKASQRMAHWKESKTHDLGCFTRCLELVIGICHYGQLRWLKPKLRQIGTVTSPKALKSNHS